MVKHILTAVFLAAALFVGYLIFMNMRKPTLEEQFEVPAPAPVITQPIPEPPRTVAPGGPNSPNAAPSLDMPDVRLPGPTDSDPYQEDYGSSDIKDNLRQPERLFGPAPPNNVTSIAVASGVASPVNQVVSEALQTFSPEFAQNGGEFIEGGIFANDTYENPNFSAI